MQSEPNTDLLLEFVLETLAPAEHERLAAQIAASPELAAEVARLRDDLAALALTLPPQRPDPALRGRVLASIAAQSRFARFSQAVGRLLGLNVARAQALLDKIDDAASWVSSAAPGVALYHLEGQGVPATAVVGFIRVRPGDSFPLHEHVGEEVLFVVQGAYRDSRGMRQRTGDEVHNPPGSRHALTALPGPDLIFLSVAYDGVKIGDELYAPGDERL